MKKLTWILMIMFLVYACRTGTEKRELRHEDRVEVPAIVQDEARGIEESYRKGEISLAEYKFRMAELQDEADRLNLRNENLSNADYLPEWAREIGLSVPSGMKILPEFSHMTSMDNTSERFNSITLVYEGNYDTAMKQAARIAGDAGIPMSTTWKKNLEMAKKLGNPLPKGVSFMNYDFGMNRDMDYIMLVEVDETGRLTISAADARQMKTIIDRHSQSKTK